MRTVSQVLDLKFKRVQFTPDLMPTDIIGTDVLETDKETGQKRYMTEMRVFNMGLGMLLVTPHKFLPKVLRQTRASRVVGEIVEGSGDVVIE